MGIGGVEVGEEEDKGGGGGGKTIRRSMNKGLDGSNHGLSSHFQLSSHSNPFRVNPSRYIIMFIISIMIIRFIGFIMFIFS